ncbi:MAG TPA: cupin domain-containing protein [Ardenticatenaceae bacterium]|nr:cupin domain-containing protein [Ardenticatenaceae bacterium]
MCQSEFDFARMIAPIEPGEFFDEFWEKRPLIVARNQPDYYSKLLSMCDLDRMLASSELRHPTLRLIKRDSSVALQRYASDTGIADIEKVLAEYQEGATINLNYLHLHWEPLGVLCSHLENIFYRRVWVNIYLTPPASQGFLPHYDTHDVFILQLAGTKHWRIYDSPTALPLRDQYYHAAEFRPDRLLHEVALHAGDLIFLPHGYIHEALTSDCSSLHATVGVEVYTWVDLYSAALEIAARQDVRLRHSPLLGVGANEHGSASLAEQFTALLDRFAEVVRPEDMMRQVAEAILLRRRPLHYGSLSDLDALPGLDVSAVLGKRAGIIARIEVSDDSVRLSYPGKQIKMPRRVEVALRFIVEADEFEVHAIPGGLSDQSKLVLVRRLIKEGFLTIVRDQN